jgi:hypothetical protein
MKFLKISQLLPRIRGGRNIFRAIYLKESTFSSFHIIRSPENPLNLLVYGIGTNGDNKLMWFLNSISKNKDSSSNTITNGAS